MAIQRKPKPPAKVKDAIIRRVQLSANAKLIEKDIKTNYDPVIEEWFIEHFRGREDRTIITDSMSAGLIQSTLVTPGSDELDLELLKELVDESTYGALFRRVTTNVFDQDRFAAAIRSGMIPAEVVAKVTSRKETKPYVKHTVTKA